MRRDAEPIETQGRDIPPPRDFTHQRWELHKMFLYTALGASTLLAVAFASHRLGNLVVNGAADFISQIPK